MSFVVCVSCLDYGILTAMGFAFSVPLMVVEERQPVRASAKGVIEVQVNGKSGASSLLGESADSPHDSSDNPLIYSNGLSSKAINSNGNAIPGNASAMDGGNEARVLGHRIARNHPQNPHLFSPSGSIQIGQNGPYAIPLSERVFGAVPNAVPSISLPMTQLRAEKMPSSFDEPYELSSSIQSRHVGMSAAALRAAADIAPQRSPQYPLARMQVC